MVAIALFKPPRELQDHICIQNFTIEEGHGVGALIVGFQLTNGSRWLLGAGIHLLHSASLAAAQLGLCGGGCPALRHPRPLELPFFNARLWAATTAIYSDFCF